MERREQKTCGTTCGSERDNPTVAPSARDKDDVSTRIDFTGKKSKIKRNFEFRLYKIFGIYRAAINRCINLVSLWR